MKYIKINLFACASVFILSGCGALIDWGKSRLYQGDTFKGNQQIIEPYMRGATVYDQFTTVAMFDALWLSAPVRTAFAQEYAFRGSKSQEHYTAGLRRQLEEPHHVIAFYVLSLHEVCLGDVSEWSLFLTVDNEKIDPIEIKSIDLPYEYQMFFGKRLTQFKDTYSVKFNAKNNEGVEYINEHTRSIKLHFRKFDKEIVLRWEYDTTGNLTSVKQSAGVPLIESRTEIVKTRY